MNIADYVKQYVAKEYEIDDCDVTDRILYGFLSDLDYFHKEELRNHRWWNTVFVVVEVGGKLIGYTGAETTGDDNARDKGWVFDPDSICEVEEYEETIFSYRKKS